MCAVKLSLAVLGDSVICQCLTGTPTLVSGRTPIFQTPIYFVLPRADDYKSNIFLTILAKYKNYTTFFILFLKTLKLHYLFDIFLDKALQAPVTGGGRMQCRYAFFAHFISSACRLVLLSNFCFKSAAGMKISRRETSCCSVACAA